MKIDDSVEIEVVSIPVTSALKVDVRALSPLLNNVEYSNVMPAVTQIEVALGLKLRVPKDFTPGGPFDEGQERLLEVIGYVSEVVDVANAHRLLTIRDHLEEVLTVSDAGEL